MNNLFDVVKKNGYAFISNFFSPSEVSTLKNRLLKIYLQCSIGDQIDIPGKVIKNQYSIGKSMRIYPEAYGEFPEFTRFQDNNLSNLVDDFFDKSFNKRLQVFSSYETLTYNDVSSLPRNAYMHIDPYHSLKFLCYLTDTNKSNGALQIIPETAWIGKNIRNENSIESLLSSDLYTFTKSNYYDKSYEDKIVYVEGKAGDLIILDTDTLHCGGIILDKGLERMTIICHNRK